MRSSRSPSGTARRSVPEIKNNPPFEAVPSDFDPTPAFATAVASALLDSGFPQERMIVQSFCPPNLDVAKSLLPDAQMLYLTLGFLNSAGPRLASANLATTGSAPSTATGCRPATSRMRTRSA